MKAITEFTDREVQALGEKATLPRLLSVPLAAIGMACLGHGLLGYHPVVVVVLTLFTTSMMFCWTSALHEACHQTLWKSRALSIWSGRILGTLVFVPYTVYRRIHIRHHAYLNQPDDWELWPYTDPKASLLFRRVFVWFDLLCGLIAGPVVYGRIYFHRDSPLRDAKLHRTIRYEYLAIALFWGTLWTLTTILGQWSQHLRAILVPMWMAAMLQTGRKLTEHLGMASYDPIMGTRTVLPRRWLLRLSSYLNFDIFIHGPHHRHPRAAHTSLEATMKSYQQRDSELNYPVYTRYWRAVLAMLPWLFKNPGCGVNVDSEPPRKPTRRNVDDFVGDVVKEIQPDAKPATSL